MTPESLGYLLHRLLHVGVKTAMRTRYPMRAAWIVLLVAAALLGGCGLPVKSLAPLVDEQRGFEKAAHGNDCSPLMATRPSARLKQFGAK